MTRPSYWIRVRGAQRDPIDVHLLAQVVLRLAAKRIDNEPETTETDAGRVEVPKPRRTTTHHGDKSKNYGRRRKT